MGTEVWHVWMSQTARASTVWRMIASRPHVAFSIGRTGEVHWDGAYACPDISVKVGLFREGTGRRGPPDWGH